MIHTEDSFVRKAYQALVRRGAARASMFVSSTVTDRDIDAFETEFGIRLPALFCAYLKAYCYDFTTICAPVPLDGMAHAGPESEKGLCWIELVSLPREDPLRNLYAGMESFRRVCTDRELVNLNLEAVKNFVPIGEMGGALCMDLSKTKVAVDDPATWQICRFREAVFDWRGAGYIDDRGVVSGEKLFPDFKTLLEVYFCGRYDRAYEQQLRACGEEMPDYSFYIWEKKV
ncbi:MAG: hypothetical protein K2P39_07020 [Lachnospiraceae bacterium]|nr:hypothetical protein [Lachnospiraceae bacterium]